LAVQILSLTKLNWASTDSLCSEPITVKYAGDIAYLTAASPTGGPTPSAPRSRAHAQEGRRDHAL
jgi:hypothetical protein